MKIRNNRFRLRFITLPGDGGTPPAAVEPEAVEPESVEPIVNEHGYPDNTPVKDMTIEQQAAYHRHTSRKHERRAKQLEPLAEKARLYDELIEKGKTPDQRAIDAAANAAVEAARAEAVEKYAIPAVRAQLQAFRPNLTSDEIDELVEDVDMSKFITDDGVDVDRIKRLADKLSAPTGSGDTPPADPAPNGGQVLGFVLGNTKPPQGNAGSVEYHRQQEAARYAQTTTK